MNIFLTERSVKYKQFYVYYANFFCHPGKQILYTPVLLALINSARNKKSVNRNYPA